MKEPTTGRRKSGPETEARILRVATDLFARDGYAETSIRDIADAAGITMPTIYLYFADKRALYLAACLAVFQRSTTEVMAALTSDRPPAQRIYDYLVTVAGALMDDPHLAKLFQRELLEADREGLAILDREAHRATVVEVERAIIEAQGELPPLAATATFALTFGMFLYTGVGEILPLADEDRADQLARHVLRFILPKVYAQLFGR